MMLPDRMALAAWMRDERFCALAWHLQELFRRLQHICDRNGRFDARAADIRAALYVRERGRVAERDVTGWLELLRQAGLIRLYTQGGCVVGEVQKPYWGQKLNFGKSVFQGEEDQPELDLPAVDPPPRRGRRRPAGSEEKGCGVLGARNAPRQDHTHTDFSLESLRKRWPHLNVEAELADAQRHVRKVRGPQAVLDLKWFEDCWLAKAGPKLPGGGTDQDTIEAEPDDWRSWLNDECPGNVYGHGGAQEGTSWQKLDPTIRRFIAARMKGAA